MASDPWVGAEIGLGFMSMQGPGDARFPLPMTGHLVMVGRGILENMSVALEQVNAPLQ